MWQCPMMKEADGALALRRSRILRQSPSQAEASTSGDLKKMLFNGYEAIASAQDVLFSDLRARSEGKGMVIFERFFLLTRIVEDLHETNLIPRPFRIEQQPALFTLIHQTSPELHAAPIHIITYSPLQLILVKTNQLPPPRRIMRLSEEKCDSGTLCDSTNGVPCDLHGRSRRCRFGISILDFSSIEGAFIFACELLVGIYCDFETFSSYRCTQTFIAVVIGQLFLEDERKEDEMI
uniref:Uncharacterized protein n=1 Tax=Ascaris lumbricoides TaxID=6252 RepID=A0A0M3HVS5_ASCLU